MTRQMKISRSSSDEVKPGINEMKYFGSICVILTEYSGWNCRYRLLCALRKRSEQNDPSHELSVY